ncbi:hypothetical protein ABPG72_022400 [Tetrahymena utriculariae]
MGQQISNGFKCAASIVKNGFSKVTNFVAKTANTIGMVANKAVHAISKGVSFVTDKINQTSKFLLEKTSIGRALTKGYNWLMNDTFIGKGIKYIGQKVNTMSQYFFEETQIGRGLVKLKKWVDSTPVGKFINKIQPIVNIASYCFGGVGGIIGKSLNYAQKFYQATNNFSQSLINKITQNPLIQYASKGYKQATKYVTNCKQFIEQKLPPFILKGDRVVDFIKRQSPWIGAGANFIKKIGSFGIESVKSIPFVKQSQQYYNTNLSRKLNTFLFKPADFLYNKVAKPIVKTVFNASKYAISSTDLYKNVNKSVNILRAHEKLTKEMPEVKNIILREQNIPNMSSKSTLDSYIKKYSTNDATHGVQKFLRTFEIINNQQRDHEKEKSLNSLVRDSQIDVLSISFNKNQRDYLNQKEHSIDGIINLKNNTKEKCQFRILDGQVFGCKIANTSQHTVVRGIYGELEPLETKQFNLEAFCGDAKLSWPRNVSDYELSSFKLNNFNGQTDQGATWRMTS